MLANMCEFMPNSIKQSALFFCLVGFHTLWPALAEYVVDSSDSIIQSVSVATNKTCSDPVISSKCICEHYTLKEGYRCSGCKDKFKWGYGCEMECNEVCTFGCDFLGNCLVPRTCKQMKRKLDTVPIRKNKNSVTNEHGACEACTSGYYGLMCELTCPKNCQDSLEGMCTRGGKCYACKEGFYGRNCTLKCPEACPKCAIDNDLVHNPNNHSEFLLAGACLTSCTLDKYGKKCEFDCPEHCDKSVIPSCSKSEGFCNRCEGNKYFGNTCESECPENCEENTCAQDSGFCTSNCKWGFWGDTCNNTCSAGCLLTGEAMTLPKTSAKKRNDNACRKDDGYCINSCKTGYWGNTCENKCPDFTGSAGCSREGGFPKNCVKGKYPIPVDEANKGIYRKGVCTDCPSNCIDKACDNKGLCALGCEVGYYGPTCALRCPSRCDGACNEKGICNACEAGFTGTMCQKQCHKSCETCLQVGQETDVPQACTSCDENSPVFLNGNGECECIIGASRSQDSDGKCDCNAAESEDKEAVFMRMPEKKCRKLCKEGTKNVVLKGESKCFSSLVYKSVILAEGTDMQQGKCGPEELEVPLLRTDKTECVREDIIREINFE